MEQQRGGEGKITGTPDQIDFIIDDRGTRARGLVQTEVKLKRQR